MLKINCIVFQHIFSICCNISVFSRAAFFRGQIEHPAAKLQLRTLMDDPVFVAINPEGVFVIDLDDVVGAQLHAFQIPNLSFKNHPKNYLVSVSGKLHHDYYSMYITITLQPMNGIQIAIK